MKLKELGEFGLINLFSRQVSSPSARVIKGIGDDTAVLQPEQGNLLLMTTDMLVEDVHFSFRYCPSRSVGWKALAVNISDIAAMGGLPSSATVAIGIPPQTEVALVEELYRGLVECAAVYETDIVGGDTVKSPHGLIINVSLLGRVEPDRVIYRSGARPGDVLMVTGPLGSSAAGFYALSTDWLPVSCETAGKVTQVHLYPSPKVTEGRILSGSGHITAMNDISDGLASEVLEICQASGTGCELDADSVPYAPAVAEICKGAGASPLEWALYGGEDFELVFTVRPEGVAYVKSALKDAGCSPAVVGRIVPPESGCSFLQNNRRLVLTPGGYDHFRG